MHDFGPLDLEPRPAQDIHLHRGVRQVLRLAAVRRLYLDDDVPSAPAPGVPGQDVHAGVGVLRQEPGLVDRRQTPVQGLPSGRDLVVVLIEGQIDQLAARDLAPGTLPDLLPLGEQVLLAGGERQLRGVRLVHPPP